MGTTPNLDLPFPEPTDPPAGSPQIRALAETLDGLISRSFETAISVPQGTSIPSGGQLPGSPYTVPFTGAGFTAPPTVIVGLQSLPSGAPFVNVVPSAISATQCQIYAYNVSNNQLTTGGAISVAVIALQSAP